MVVPACSFLSFTASIGVLQSEHLAGALCFGQSSAEIGSGVATGFFLAMMESATDESANWRDSVDRKQDHHHNNGDDRYLLERKTEHLTSFRCRVENGNTVSRFFVVHGDVCCY